MTDWVTVVVGVLLIIAFVIRPSGWGVLAWQVVWLLVSLLTLVAITRYYFKWAYPRCAAVAGFTAAGVLALIGGLYGALVWAV